MNANASFLSAQYKLYTTAANEPGSALRALTKPKVRAHAQQPRSSFDRFMSAAGAPHAEQPQPLERTDAQPVETDERVDVKTRTKPSPCSTNERPCEARVDAGDERVEQTTNDSAHVSGREAEREIEDVGVDQSAIVNQVVPIRHDTAGVVAHDEPAVTNTEPNEPVEPSGVALSADNQAGDASVVYADQVRSGPRGDTPSLHHRVRDNKPPSEGNDAVRTGQTGPTDESAEQTNEPSTAAKREVSDRQWFDRLTRQMVGEASLYAPESVASVEVKPISHEWAASTNVAAANIEARTHETRPVSEVAQQSPLPPTDAGLHAAVSASVNEKPDRFEAAVPAMDTPTVTRQQDASSTAAPIVNPIVTVVKPTATTNAQQTGATQPHREPIAQQAAVGLAVAMRDIPSPAGQRSVTMQLHPASMGQLRVELHVAGDVVAVKFLVGSAKARQAVDKSMADLKRAVERQGLTIESISVAEDRALAAPKSGEHRADSADHRSNSFQTGADGQYQGRHHAGNPFADAPRSIAGAEPSAWSAPGDGVASDRPTARDIEDGVLRIVTYRLDAVA